MNAIIDYIKQHVLGSVIVAIALGILSLAMYIIVEIQTLKTYTSVNHAVTDLRLEHIESDIGEIKGDIRYIRDNGRTTVERE